MDFFFEKKNQLHVPYNFDETKQQQQQQNSNTKHRFICIKT